MYGSYAWVSTEGNVMAEIEQEPVEQRMPREGAERLGVGIQGAATAQAACDAELLRLLAEFDAGRGWAWYEGIDSCAHWLAWACSMMLGTAREHVRVARALPAMPTVAARFAEGSVSYSKVREITRLAGKVDEAGLVELAQAQTAGQLARTVRSYRAADGSHQEQVDRRRMSWRETEDGMVRLSVTLLPEEAAVVRGAVETAIDHHLTQPPDPIDPITALCDVARGYLESPPTHPFDDANVVVVHVGIETLVEACGLGHHVPAGTSPEALRANQAWIERGGPIEAATAARLACECRAVGMVQDANGDVLAMGRTRRLATPSQHRALRVRDGHCQFPGCQQCRRLKAHHVVFWSAGGRTDMDNLMAICQHHHTYVHEGRVRVSGSPGAWRFTLPDGRTLDPGNLPEPDEIDAVIRLAAARAAEDPERISPIGGGEGFSLHECVRVLFDLRLPEEEVPLAA